MGMVPDIEYQVFRALIKQTDRLLFDAPGTTYTRSTGVGDLASDVGLCSTIGVEDLTIENFSLNNDRGGDLDPHKLPELEIVDNGNFVFSRVGFNKDCTIGLIHVHCHVAGYYFVFANKLGQWQRQGECDSFFV